MRAIHYSFSSLFNYTIIPFTGKSKFLIMFLYSKNSTIPFYDPTKAPLKSCFWYRKNFHKNFPEDKKHFQQEHDTKRKTRKTCLI